MQYRLHTIACYYSSNFCSNSQCAGEAGPTNPDIVIRNALSLSAQGSTTDGAP